MVTPSNRTISLWLLLAAVIPLAIQWGRGTLDITAAVCLLLAGQVYSHEHHAEPPPPKGGLRQPT